MADPDFVVHNAPLAIRREVWEKVLSGVAYLDGGTVRDSATKQIVSLPKGAPDAVVKAGEQAARGVAVALKKHPRTIGAGVVGLAAVAVTTYTVVDHQKKKVSALLDEHSAALGAYLDAAEGGAIGADHLDRLLSALDQLEASYRGQLVKFVLPVRAVQPLVLLVADHTRRLADSRAVDQGGLPELTSGRPKGTVDELRQHLQAQRQMVALAA